MSTKPDAVRAALAEREAFEAWCVKRWCGDRGGDNFLRFETDGPYADQYRKGNVEFAWCAWQARAALAEQPAEPVGSGTKLWLWKNGDHYLAFRHLYPCYEPGGDPMTLGEPAAWAVFRHSHNREGKPNEQQRIDGQGARDRADANVQRRYAASAGQTHAAGDGASLGYGQHQIAPQGGWGAGVHGAGQESISDNARASSVLASGRDRSQGVSVPHQAPGVAVPEGWQLVPKTLTTEMRSAMLSCESGEFSVQGGWDYILAAAPKPEDTK